MTTKERQKAILSYLRDESTPVSATTLAKLLGVSRQIIVGDVALSVPPAHMSWPPPGAM